MLQRQDLLSDADKELLEKVAALHRDDEDGDADDGNSQDRFGRLNPIQRSALGLGDMATALSGGGNEGLNDRDEGGRAPLHHVCQRGDVEGVRLLLHAGAHVDVRDDFGSTPLMIASENGAAGCAKLLVELGGSEIDARDCPGRSALHYAAGAPGVLGGGGVHETIAYLLSRKAPYGRTNLGVTPLHFLGPDEKGISTTAETVEEEASRRLETLLRFGGAHIDEVDGRGRRPVDWAIREERASALKVLIRAGAAVGGLSLGDVDGRNILHSVAMYGNQATIAVLREAAAELTGVHVRQRDKYGDTPEDCLCLRKSGAKANHWASQLRMPSQEEVDAIRALFAEVSKRNEAADRRACEFVKEALHRYHDSRGALRLLTPLIEQKSVWNKDADVQTLNAIAVQIRQGSFDAAVESLDEVMEIWAKGEELGPLVVESGGL